MILLLLLKEARRIIINLSYIENLNEIKGWYFMQHLLHKIIIKLPIGLGIALFS